jgi:hypothetical protein
LAEDLGARKSGFTSGFSGILMQREVSDFRYLPYSKEQIENTGLIVFQISKPLVISRELLSQATTLSLPVGTHAHHPRTSSFKVTNFLDAILTLCCERIGQYETRLLHSFGGVKFDTNTGDPKVCRFRLG